MTRINVVPVESIHYKHLIGEYRELPRVFTLARNAQREVLSGRKKLPPRYTLGTGHVLFFYDKLGYCHKRYQDLAEEMFKRGYNPSPVPSKDLLAGIDKKMLNSYIPTPEAIKENQERINQRLKEMK